MDVTHPDISAYLHREEASRHPVLRSMEARAAAEGFPIIGPLVGRTCGLLARAVGAARIFEMGSGFGYSTLQFALAVPEAEIHHTDGDPSNTSAARALLAEAGVVERVRFHTGDALEALRRAEGVFDVVFLDVDKHQYPAAWDIAVHKIRRGGLILADNTLWHGRVTREARDPDTRGIQDYNAASLSDARFLTTLLPLRDGLSVSLRVA